MAPQFVDYECKAEEHINDNTPLPQSVLTNNERTGPSIQPLSTAPMTPLFDDSDHDEGDIFEEDEDDDEGYLFAGQGICVKDRLEIKSSTTLSKLL